MEDINYALDSVDQCTLKTTREDSGEGANAVSRADKVFIVSSLSELVWSPNKGLDFKRAHPSLDEKKASLMWSTESFKIVISPPECASGEKIDFAGTLNRDHGLKQGSCGCMERLKGIEEAPVMDINQQESYPLEIKAGIYSPRSRVITGNPQPDAICFANKSSKSGPDDGRCADSLSSKSEEFTLNLAQIEAEGGDSDEGISPEQVKTDSQNKDDQTTGLVEVFASESSMLKPSEKSTSIPGFQVCKLTESEHNEKMNTISRVIPPITYLHPKGKQCAGGEHSLILNGTVCHRYACNLLAKDRSDLLDMDVTAIPQSSSDGKEKILDIPWKENSTLLGMAPNKNGDPSEQAKGKERVFDTGDDGSFSKDKDDSHESVESSTSKEPFSAGKRARSFELDMFVGSKKLKNSNSEKSCSGSLLGEGSSFMNWISNVTKGRFRSDSAERPLMLVPKSFHNKYSNPSPPKSHDKKKDVDCRDMGFQSIFQALHHPGLKGHCKTAVRFDHPEEADGSKQPQVDNKTIEFCGDQLVLDGEHTRSHKPVLVSGARLNNSICQFGKLSPTVPNNSVSSSPIQEKLKHEVGEYCKMCHIGSSSSSFQNGSSSQSEYKEASKLGSVLPSTSPDSSMGIGPSGFPGSLWISRFSPKLSAPMLHVMHCNQGKNSAAKRVTDDCNMFNQNSQKDIVSVRDHNDLEDCRQSPLQVQRISTCGHLQNCSRSLMDSCCSKKLHNDQKLKSKLNPILPSQTFKQMEPMTSVFSKRLDAFRQVSTPESADGIKLDTTTCLFCGKGGHSINHCSEVIASEMDDLIRNISSYDKAENETCLCIRCFQHNHWAVACPYTPLKSSHHGDGTASIINNWNVLRIDGRHGKYASFVDNCDTGMCNRSKNGQGQVSYEHKIPCRENLSMGTDIMVQTSINMDEDDIVYFRGSALNAYPVRENIFGKGVMKGKQIASISEESHGKRTVPFCNLMPKQIPREQSQIFDRIRRLRLSRSDIVRWMKSTVSPFSLEGFFLRVRLGKWEEGLGGTGYHVASISSKGVSEERPYGDCRSHVPVTIRGLKFLVDCCFVSNHDFSEDELKDWWSATSKRGGKLPLEEELDKKLQEREKLGL